VNLPEALGCRKCGVNFGASQEIIIPAAVDAQCVSQAVAKNILAKGILTEGKKIFSISAKKGMGKTIVMKGVLAELAEERFSLIMGKCTSITQLTPGGLIQDMLLNIFNLPNFCTNDAQYTKDAVKFFKSGFPNLTPEEALDLVNFLYPTMEGMFENLFARKAATFEMLYKIFDVVTQFNKFILVVDNFDMIDGFSYEFLHRFIEKDHVWHNLKLILTYNEPKPARGYFQLNDDGAYVDMRLAGLDSKNI